MKTFALLATVAAFAVAGPALAAEGEVKAESTVKYDADGSYKKETNMERTDAAGTKHTSDTTVDVDADDNGNIEKRIETKTTTDPEGLLNKQTEKTIDKVKTVDGKTTYETEKTVNGETVVDRKVESR